MSEQVREMFSDIAPKYDRTNRILSLGVDQGWRRKAVKASGAQPGGDVLDLATGTADLALRLARRVGPAGRVTATDFCAPMLEVGRKKAAKAGLDIRFEEADAQSLPYADDAFDACTIAFGLRNVDEPHRCLQEMLRVVRPGGRAVVLEFGQPSGPIAAPYHWYSRHVMPRLGGWLTGNRAAYEYLPDTAARFPCGDAFEALVEEAVPGAAVSSKPLTGGIAWLYTLSH